MAELVQLTPTLGINVAQIASWQDLPTKLTPCLIVSFAACAADSQGLLQSMTEYYYGEAREALLRYFAAHANGSYALPPTTEGE
jgi:hypothetical protein